MPPVHSTKINLTYRGQKDLDFAKSSRDKDKGLARIKSEGRRSALERPINVSLTGEEPIQPSGTQGVIKLTGAPVPRKNLILGLSAKRPPQDFFIKAKISKRKVSTPEKLTKSARINPKLESLLLGVGIFLYSPDAMAATHTSISSSLTLTGALGLGMVYSGWRFWQRIRNWWQNPSQKTEGSQNTDPSSNSSLRSTYEEIIREFQYQRLGEEGNKEGALSYSLYIDRETGEFSFFPVPDRPGKTLEVRFYLDRLVMVKLAEQDRWYLEKLLENSEFPPKAKNLMKSILNLDGLILFQKDPVETGSFGIFRHASDPYQMAALTSLWETGYFGSDSMNYHQLKKALFSLSQDEAGKAFLQALRSPETLQELADLSKGFETNVPYSKELLFIPTGRMNGELVLSVFLEGISQTQDLKQLIKFFDDKVIQFQSLYPPAVRLGEEIVKDLCKKTGVADHSSFRFRKALLETWLMHFINFSMHQDFKSIKKYLRDNKRGKVSLLFELDSFQNNFLFRFDKRKPVEDREQSLATMAFLLRNLLDPNQVQLTVEAISIYRNTLSQLPSDHPEFKLGIKKLVQLASQGSLMVRGETIHEFLTLISIFSTIKPILESHGSFLLKNLGEDPLWGRIDLLEKFSQLVWRLPSDHPFRQKVDRWFQELVERYPQDRGLAETYQKFKTGRLD